MSRQTSELARSLARNLPSDLVREFPAEGVADRLAGEFRILPRGMVERSVTEARLRAEHLGFKATPALVEGIAREHLVGVLNAVPPSGTPF